MSQQVKTSKGVVITLVAGFGLGAITMAGIGSGAFSGKALAQSGQVQARMIGDTKTESLTELHNLDESFANLAEFVAPAVVDIRATTNRAMGENGERLGTRQGEGSGFIFKSDGYIMTNDHVVGGADKVQVVLKDGREFDGKVIRAEDSDIAIVKIEATDLPFLAFGDSSKMRSGQMCMAVGAPFGLENSVTFGHVSALGRDQEIPDGYAGLNSRYYPDLIQTDASINMGNSGGPLINIDGQVIGVNTAIYSPTGVSAGIGFAIPSNQAKFIGDMLVKDGKITRAMIGLVPENLKEYERKELKLKGGARVFSLQPESPAAKAGIKKGDIVLKIGQTPINSQLDLRNAMLVYTPGTKVPVELVRDGKSITVDVTLEKYKKPEAPKRAPRLEDMPGADKDGRFNFPKDFDSPDIKEFRRQFDREGGPAPDDVPQLREGQARLGVTVGNVTDALRKEQNIPADVRGAFVADVQPGSVADKLGIKAGDVITEFNGKKLVDSESLTNEMAKVKWGETRSIKFSRFAKGSAVNQERSATFK